MSYELPEFRYHPNPVGSGAIVERDISCIACDQDRRYAYVGPVYTAREIDEESICPWCISDGAAAHTLEASFVDDHELAGLAEGIIATVTTRTPCYTGWQQEVWLTHCDDACAFLDRIGKAELEYLPAAATDAVRSALRDYGRTDAEREQFLSWLHREGDLTAYLFQCLGCGLHLAHVDSS